MHKSQKRKAPRWLVVVLAGFAVVIAIIAVIGGGLGGKPSHPAAASHKAPATANDVQAPAPVSTPSTASRVRTWWYGDGLRMFHTLEGDLGQLSTNATAVNFSATKNDAEQLQQAVLNDEATMPVPDPAIQRTWRKALTDLLASAKDYITGIDITDASLIQAGTARLIKAEYAIEIMTRQVTALEGR